MRLSSGLIRVNGRVQYSMTQHDIEPEHALTGR